MVPSLLGLGYLSLRERIACARALCRLAKMPAGADSKDTIAAWLRDCGQSERAIELFWTPVIVSALAEEVDRVGVAAARKVFVDAFLRSDRGYEMRYPVVPLARLYDHYVAQFLEQHSVRIHLGRGVRRVLGVAERATGLEHADGERRDFDRIVVAVPWFRADELFVGGMRERLSFLSDLNRFEPSPITSVHLWSDGVLIDGDHLVLPGRFSQWIFKKGSGFRSPRRLACGEVQGSERSDGASHYYQVVISGSRELDELSRDEIVRRVRQDIDDLSPRARERGSLPPR